MTIPDLLQLCDDSDCNYSDVVGEGRNVNGGTVRSVTSLSSSSASNCRQCQANHAANHHRHDEIDDASKSGGGSGGSGYHSNDSYSNPQNYSSGHHQVWPLTHFFQFAMNEKSNQWPHIGDGVGGVNIFYCSLSWSWTFEGLSKLAKHPLRAHNLPSSIDYRTSEIKGNCPGVSHRRWQSKTANAHLDYVYLF